MPTKDDISGELYYNRQPITGGIEDIDISSIRDNSCEDSEVTTIEFPNIGSIEPFELSDEIINGLEFARYILRRQLMLFKKTYARHWKKATCVTVYYGKSRICGNTVYRKYFISDNNDILMRKMRNAISRDLRRVCRKIEKERRRILKNGQS